MDQSIIAWVFSGIGVTILLSLFKMIFIPHPIISISLEEIPFLTGYQRIVRKIFIELSAMMAFIYFTVVPTSFNTTEHIPISTFPFIPNSLLPNAITLSCVVIAGILFTFFFILILNKKLLRYTYKKVFSNKSIFWVFFIFIITYLIILSVLFGYTINIILSYLNHSLNISQEDTFTTLFSLPSIKAYFGISMIVLLMYGFLRLLFQPLVRIYINFLKPVIVATITLTNGEKLYNKYIFRPSIEGNILIGDKPEPTEDCEKIMLPKSSILLK